jgi:hypothetical protein
MTDLIANHRSEIEALCRRHGVLSLAVFGSAARGELQPGSDVDLLVEFKPDAEVGLLEFEDLRSEFSSLFGRPVDLAGPAILRNPYRRRAIMRDLRPIYSA